MTVPAAKVKALCTASEVDLVRASRPGKLEDLSYAEVKQHADRARKLVDKWRDLKRGQSRTRSRESGAGTADANTKLKKQIFRDALASFNARLEQLAAEGAHTAAPAPRGKTKPQRTAEHRATRAAVRKGMVAAQDLVNSSLGNDGKPAAKPASAKPAAKAPAGKPPATKKPKPVAAQPAAKSEVAARPPKKPAPGKPRNPLVATLDPAKQRKAVVAAKQSRVARSGKTTRVLSHVKSRGKRVQARRDARN